MMGVTKEDIGKLFIFKTKSKGLTYKGYLVDFNKEIYKLKLIDNGYNIGILKENIENIEIIDQKVTLGKLKSEDIEFKENLPNIVYIGTGGTIGTHVDYITGAVTMCRTPQEIISTTPEIKDLVNIKYIESPFIKASEDLFYKDWQKLSEIIFKYLKDDSIDGIIITHGTDTLSYTGSALSFMIENINKPVLLVGAQRSPDRASFDGALNLKCASLFIKEKVPGVFTVMHGSINDDYCDVIKAVKSRKMHTSRRDAFKAINDTPLCKVFPDGNIEYYFKEKIIKKDLVPVLKNDFEEKVAILKVYPNSDPSIIEWYIKNNYKGLVLEGTGLGHVPVGEQLESLPEKYQWLKYIKKAIKNDLIVIMASQCLFGRVNDKVYSNLRYIKKEGVEYLDNHDISSEVLYIKLGVALKRFNKKEDVFNFLKKNICGEISLKEITSNYEKSI